MVAYVLKPGVGSMFDPAVGAGAFFRAAKRVASELSLTVRLEGTEIDPRALSEAEETGLSKRDLRRVQIRDFVLDPPRGSYEAIVANPPYIRHHRLPAGMKLRAKAFAHGLLRRPLDGRAGLHIYFLLRALQLLRRGGRLAYIMPADTCEGAFAPLLWEWITKHYALDAVVTFDPAATPFPGVDTNPLIFMISNEAPSQSIVWARCLTAGSSSLKNWVLSGFRDTSRADLTVAARDLREALATGLSRSPRSQQHNGLVLGDVATVLRGIATGANEFFFLTQKRADDLGIPHEFLRQAVGRTRDAQGEVIDAGLIRQLEAAGRPTLLLCLDGRPMEEFPKSVQAYLKRGVEAGLPRRPLIASRRPWYKMEIRKVPPILFAYLGRRNARFVFNKAGVVPLTGFLCVYPRENSSQALMGLWEVLKHPKTLGNLALVGKSYGSGAIKVEPRALERLPLDPAAVQETGLRPVQLTLAV